MFSVLTDRSASWIFETSSEVPTRMFACGPDVSSAKKQDFHYSQRYFWIPAPDFGCWTE
jgi:hypothetical protein